MRPDLRLLFICFDCFVFFFNATATTEIYTLSLHDALPISSTGDIYFSDYSNQHVWKVAQSGAAAGKLVLIAGTGTAGRSEEHTSELQSRFDLVCRLLLEKKKEPLDTTFNPICILNIEVNTL